LGDLRVWKCRVAIHPEEVTGSRRLRFVYPGIAQFANFTIE
jgi:hypothetical protein